MRLQSAWPAGLLEELRVQGGCPAPANLWPVSFWREEVQDCLHWCSQAYLSRPGAWPNPCFFEETLGCGDRPPLFLGACPPCLRPQPVGRSEPPRQPAQDPTPFLLCQQHCFSSAYSFLGSVLLSFFSPLSWSLFFFCFVMILIFSIVKIRNHCQPEGGSQGFLGWRC